MIEKPCGQICAAMRGTKAVLPKSLTIGVCEAHFCSFLEKEM